MKMNLEQSAKQRVDEGEKKKMRRKKEERREARERNSEKESVEGHLWKAQWKEKPNDESHRKLTMNSFKKKKTIRPKRQE